LLKRKCVIQIKNIDKYCLARALVVAIAHPDRLKDQTRWNRIRLCEAKRHPDQLDEAKALMKKELDFFYFLGKPAKKVLTLYHHGNPYDVLTSMKAFFQEDIFAISAMLHTITALIIDVRKLVLQCVTVCLLVSKVKRNFAAIVEDTFATKIVFVNTKSSNQINQGSL